jgi:hypothetical protein
VAALPSLTSVADAGGAAAAGGLDITSMSRMRLERHRGTCICIHRWVGGVRRWGQGGGMAGSLQPRVGKGTAAGEARQGTTARPHG